MIQRTFNCSMKTAWFLTHRIREIMKPEGDTPSPLGGEGKTLEAGVTYVGRKPMKKSHRGGGSNMNQVFSLVEREGGVRSVHMLNVRVENLGAVLENHASGTSDLMTDEAAAFAQLGWNFRSHQSVNHSKDEYVRRILGWIDYPNSVGYPAPYSEDMTKLGSLTPQGREPRSVPALSA
jgi:hypothetical protein